MAYQPDLLDPDYHRLILKWYKPVNGDTHLSVYLLVAIRHFITLRHHEWPSVPNHIASPRMAIRHFITLR